MIAMQIADIAIASFHRERDLAADWQPITAYDRASAQPVLFRGEGQMVFGVWGRGDDPEGSEERETSWRSLEESTLDSPLWFEPQQFALLKDEYEQFFLQR